MRATKILKALGHETRYKMLQLLLQHNYCVRALSKTWADRIGSITTSKGSKEAGLLVGVKRGYYMHYDVNQCLARTFLQD